MTGVTSSWQVHTKLLKNIAIKVKLAGCLSDPVCLHQGIGQGKILATENYKVYINPLLKMLENANVGAKIGPIYCGCPTCADDIIMLATSDYELQIMLQLQIFYSHGS